MKKAIIFLLLFIKEADRMLAREHNRRLDDALSELEKMEEK